MADEFIWPAQALGIEDTFVVKRHSVVERGTQCEAGLPEALDIAQEPKGAGAGEVTLEDATVEIDCLLLAADQTRGEINLDLKAKALFGRAEFGEGTALVDTNGLEDLQIAARRAHFLNADLADGGNEVG